MIVEQLKERRLKLGMKQTELAALAGVSSNYICRLEAGEIRDPSYSKITSITQVLDGTEEAQRASKPAGASR
jgi:predicted transcriptional regulator